MPKFRTEHYAIWRACERMRMRPPDVKENWDDNNGWVQAKVIAYSQIREYEDSEEYKGLLQAGGARLG